MKKFILCLLFTLIFYNSALAVERLGTPMYCRVQIEYREKEDVMRQITEDMEKEGYQLEEKSHISLSFETSLRKSNRFNYAADFGMGWFPRNRYGWIRSEFSRPIYNLSVTVVKKTVTSVEVTITPIIIWNPGNAYQEEIYEYYPKTKKALNKYLGELKIIFENIEEDSLI